MDSYKPDICIYHGNCDDGFCAAWAVWRKWPETRFVPGVYGKTLDWGEIIGKHILFVDFSLKRADTDALVNSGAESIVILDHHKTAEAELAPFTVGACGDADLVADDISGMLRDLAELNRPPIIARFDMQSSGARLAWAFCHGIEHNGAPPTIVSLIEDRDLWRFTYGLRTKRFSAALRTYPMDFTIWETIAQNTDKLIEEGEPILRAHQANIEKFTADAYTQLIGGHRVPCCNVPYHYASDTAHALLQKHPDAPFAAAWFKRGDEQVQFSLRSEDARLDVSEIAKKYGGGGHRNAAGFQYNDNSQLWWP